MKNSIYKMDRYERELEKMAENGEFVEVNVTKEYRKLLRQTAKRYVESKLKLASGAESYIISALRGGVTQW